MDNQTEGVKNLKKESFESAENYQEDLGGNKSVFGDNFDNSNIGISHWPKFLEYLKKDVIFSFLFISILGYIIIAAFGGIKNWDDYIRYVLFFIIIFLLYKIFKKK